MPNNEASLTIHCNRSKVLDLWSSLVSVVGQKFAFGTIPIGEKVEQEWFEEFRIFNFE